ncbi:MAG: hypothetical protein K8T25_14875 [Planctomycetia bacterium]|nr:hypothetical protein [Planctomycetia bacterium]
MTDPSPKPKRRWFQYRLQTLLILTAIIAVAMTWWSLRVRPQQNAVAALRQIGCQFEYDSRLPFTGGMKDPPKWPTWLLDAVGVDYFGTVKYVIFLAGATDTDLKPLQALTTVQGLCLMNGNISDAGLEQLKNLTALKGLNLYDTQVTDAGIEHLKGLTALRELELEETQVTDAGVARLKKLLPKCDIHHYHPPH